MPVATESKTDYFKPIPSGTHLARCFGTVALGTQIPSNKTYKPANKVMLLFELPQEVYEVNGRDMPMTIAKSYRLSINKKATLRKDLDSWRGRAFTEEEAKGFPVENVIGAPCMLSVTHTPKNDGTGGVWVNIASISGIPKGLQVPELVHPKIQYELEMGKNQVFESLPEWIRGVIGRCVEWNASAVVQEPSDPTDDDIEMGDTSVPF